MEKKEKKRITAAPENGLTRQQVQARMEQGLYNKESVLPTKSIPRIIRDNTCTLFNLILWTFPAMVYPAFIRPTNF